MAMEMDHSFTVPVSPDQAWDVLLDVERIAPCMPGATVDEFDGEVVTGRIKVKVGPVSLTYRGTAKFTERDPDAKMIVLEASGKETRGAGTASATVQADAGARVRAATATKATMHTTMNVTGRPAQFGRGVIVEVGGKLVEQFAQNLRQLITDDSAARSRTRRGRGRGRGATGTAAGRDRHRRRRFRGGRERRSVRRRSRPNEGHHAPGHRRPRPRRRPPRPPPAPIPSTWSGWSARRSSSGSSRSPRSWPP